VPHLAAALPKSFLTNRNSYQNVSRETFLSNQGSRPLPDDHVIEKGSLKFNEPEHVPIEKADQLFRDRLSPKTTPWRGYTRSADRLVVPA
jgi:hypothetical protein